MAHPSDQADQPDPTKATDRTDRTSPPLPHGARLAGCSAGRFTLIELLVVISIIAVLASMLLPALQRAKEQGRRAVCYSNLRQIGIALITYADDNGNWLPFSYGTSGIDLYGSDGKPCRLGLLTANRYIQPLSPTDARAVILDCPGRSYEEFGPTNGYWRWRQIGYSFAVPYSAFDSTQPYCFKLTDYNKLKYWWAPYNTFRALVACYRGNGMGPAPFTPHLNDGNNALYFDGAVRFISRPRAGWGFYPWDATQTELGSMYDDMPYWNKAHDSY